MILKPRYAAVDQLVADFTEAGVEVQSCPSSHYKVFQLTLGMNLNSKQTNIN